MLQTTKGCRCFSSKIKETEIKTFAFPWPHGSSISTLLVNNPKKASLSQSAYYGYKTRAQHQKPRRNAGTTSNQVFPKTQSQHFSAFLYYQELSYQSLCKMQNSNDYFSKFLIMTRWKQREMEVCIVKHLRCKGIFGGKMQKWTNMHT